MTRPCVNEWGVRTLGIGLGALSFSTKIEALTFLRFIAALAVVLYHFGPAAGLHVSPGLGPLMVTFFFVLSGFVLAITYLSRASFDASRFLMNRFSRIAPVYFLALLLMVGIAWSGGRPPDPAELALNLSFLQAWVPPYPLTINPPGWSLSVEAYLYLSFPFVAGAVLRWSPRHAIKVCVAAWLLTQFVLSLLLAHSGYAPTGAIHDIVFYSPLAHWCSFLLGVVGGHWYVREGSAFRGRSADTAVMLAAMAAIVLVSTQAQHFRKIMGMPIAVESSFLAPLFLLLVLSVALAPDRVGRALSLRPFVVLGNASYSLYILQMPVYFLYRQIAAEGAPLDTLPQFLGFVLVLMLVSIAVYYLFERPIMRLLRSSAPATALETRVNALK